MAKAKAAAGAGSRKSRFMMANEKKSRPKETPVPSTRMRDAARSTLRSRWSSTRSPKPGAKGSPEKPTKTSTDSRLRTAARAALNQKFKRKITTKKGRLFDKGKETLEGRAALGAKARAARAAKKPRKGKGLNNSLKKTRAALKKQGVTAPRGKRSSSLGMLNKTRGEGFARVKGNAANLRAKRQKIRAGG